MRWLVVDSRFLVSVSFLVQWDSEDLWYVHSDNNNDINDVMISKHILCYGGGVAADPALP